MSLSTDGINLKNYIIGLSASEVGLYHVCTLVKKDLISLCGEVSEYQSEVQLSDWDSVLGRPYNSLSDRFCIKCSNKLYSILIYT